MLRLDTDWYESTLHELVELYPLLSEGGVLIIDDYGDWQGARRAVDEFFRDRAVLLHRIDATGRIVVKPSELPSTRHPRAYLDLALTIAPPTGGGAETSA